MHIIPAIENNADGFSSFALNLFKQHPHFHQQACLGFLSAPKRYPPGNSTLPGHSPWSGRQGATREAEGDPENRQSHSQCVCETSEVHSRNESQFEPKQNEALNSKL